MYVDDSWRRPLAFPLGGRRDLDIRRLGGTPGSSGCATATAATGLSREPASGTTLAAGSVAVITATATSGRATASGAVVAASICVRFRASLLDDDALAVHVVRVRGYGSGVACLGHKLDECAVLVPIVSHTSTKQYDTTPNIREGKRGRGCRGSHHTFWRLISKYASSP